LEWRTVGPKSYRIWALATARHSSILRVPARSLDFNRVKQWLPRGCLGSLGVVSFTMGLSGWQCWASGIAADAPWRMWIDGEVRPAPGDGPPLKDVKPIQRRRLSPIARGAFFCAKECLGAAAPVATVFCSAHGEGERTFELLDAIATDAALSPNTFSLSVHNSIAGLFGIINDERAPSVALAAGQDGIGVAFAEAWGLLEEHPAGDALVVLYDDAMPAPFGVGDDAPEAGVAAAFRLSRDPGAPQFRLDRRRPSAQTPAPHWAQIRDVVDFLQSGRDELVLRSDRADWVWSARAGAPQRSAS
jgi:hypothetical protein